MYKLIFLCILLIILCVVKKMENFSAIYFSNNTFPVKHINTFKYLNDKSQINLNRDIDTYMKLSSTPKLKFKSFDTCPNLYNLFHGIKLYDPETKKYVRGENTEGIRFRNECEKVFYNTTQFVRIEHPIINIEGEDIGVEEVEDTSGEISKERIFKDRYQEMSFYPFKDDSEIINYLPVFDENKDMPRFCNFNKKVKQINFGVKSDFKLEDIFRFVDYCFTQLCLGMIYIENMKLTSNHYRVFPCLCRTGSFFILPERIRHIASMEGKYYSRAKCNACCMNLLVLFGTELPDKFNFIYKHNYPGACSESNDIFKSEEELDKHEF